MTKKNLGLLGAVILILGVFSPVIRMPMVGSLNYFRNGSGEGVFVLLLAVISLLLIFAKRSKGLWFTGIASLSILTFTFINFQITMHKMKEELSAKLEGNIFRGLANIAMESIQLEWGWALLLVGTMMIIMSAAKNDVVPSFEKEKNVPADDDSM